MDQALGRLNLEGLPVTEAGGGPNGGLAPFLIPEKTCFGISSKTYLCDA